MTDPRELPPGVVLPPDDAAARYWAPYRRLVADFIAGYEHALRAARIAPPPAPDLNASEWYESEPGPRPPVIE